MKKLSVCVVVSVVALALYAGNLLGQEAGKKKQAGAKPTMSQDERFKSLDKDGDGFLSVEEFKASFRRGPAADQFEVIFKLKDTDKDGKVSLAEFKVSGFEELALKFDADKDGKVTLDEMKKAGGRNPDMAEKMFKSRDRNGDGAITKDDFVQTKKGKVARAGKGGGRKGKKAAP